MKAIAWAAAWADTAAASAASQAGGSAWRPASCARISGQAGPRSVLARSRHIDSVILRLAGRRSVSIVGASAATAYG